MNTTDFARRVADEHGWSYSLAHQVVNGVVETMHNILAEGKDLSLRGVGHFDYVKRGGHEVYASWSETGKFMLPEAHYVRFTPVRTLKRGIRALDNSVFADREESSIEEDDSEE